MRLTNILNMLFMCFLMSNAQSLVDPLTPTNVLPVGDTLGNRWTLTFSDEFNGVGAPDSNKWITENYDRRPNPVGPDGWWSSDDSYMENGNMVIRVRSIPNTDSDSDPYDYSCGAILSQGKFQQLYGKYEVRCKLPSKQGWWVAFWMMQGNEGSIGNGGIDGSEVDIFEGFGWGNKINQAIHWDGYGAEHKSVSNQIFNSDYYSGYHTYSLEWSPAAYKFFIDGMLTWTSTGGGVCNQPGHILITGEISTLASLTGTNWANVPDPSLYPDYFLVDYVRVWKDNSIMTGIANNKQDNWLHLSVNQRNVNIYASSTITSLVVYDTLGKVIRNFANQTNSYTICLKQGIYIVHASYNNGDTYIRKLIIV